MTSHIFPPIAGAPQDSDKAIAASKKRSTSGPLSTPLVAYEEPYENHSSVHVHGFTSSFDAHTYQVYISVQDTDIVVARKRDWVVSNVP